MDPWLDRRQNVAVVDNNNSKKTFEDNFKPSFQQLPDSEQYLALLESKLERIRNDPNLLKQLAEKREACMRQLLNSATDCLDDEYGFDTQVDSSLLLRTIAPQRVAINQGEVVRLVKHDYLLEENGTN